MTLTLKIAITGFTRWRARVWLFPSGTWFRVNSNSPVIRSAGSPSEVKLINYVLFFFVYPASNTKPGIR